MKLVTLYRGPYAQKNSTWITVSPELSGIFFYQRNFNFLCVYIRYFVLFLNIAFESL